MTNAVIATECDRRNTGATFDDNPLSPEDASRALKRAIWNMGYRHSNRTKRGDWADALAAMQAGVAG